MGRKELAAELRELRKTHSDHKPVSKLKLFEIAGEIERLKHMRATTPASASYTTNKSTPELEVKVKNVKKAKEAEFPVAPKGVASGKKKAESKEEKVVEKMTVKKGVKKPVEKKAKKVVEIVSESDEE